MSQHSETSGRRVGNVVFLNTVRNTQTRSAARPEQLVMDFDPPRKLLVVVAENLHGSTFLQSLLENRPTMLVDFRFAPHFNFTAIDGQTARRQIDSVGTLYVQCPVPFHEYSSSLLRHDPQAIAQKLPNCAIAKGVMTGPLMVLVKEVAVARALAPFLAAALCEQLGGTWQPNIIV